MMSVVNMDVEEVRRKIPWNSLTEKQKGQIGELLKDFDRIDHDAHKLEAMMPHRKSFVMDQVHEARRMVKDKINKVILSRVKGGAA